jgi:hypothetical protein
MSAAIIPLPGWAVHIWPSRGGWYGVAPCRGNVDPDFPPEGAPLVEEYSLALDQAVSIQDRTGFPIISHVENL